MRRFKIQKNSNLEQMIVTLHQAPYDNKSILNRTGWKEKDVTITEMPTYQGEE